MEYVVVKGGKIMGHYSATSPAKIPLGKGESLKVATDVFLGNVGDEVLLYDEGLKRKPNSQLVQEGLIEIPKDMRLEKEIIIPKTPLEKFKEGLINRNQAFEELGYAQKRQEAISRISGELDKYRNEVAMVEAGIRQATEITYEEYIKKLFLLERWKDFKETCDVENPKYPE